MYELIATLIACVRMLGHTDQLLWLSGKPIFSLHGDENALAGLMAILQALVSFVKDQGDALQSVK